MSGSGLPYTTLPTRRDLLLLFYLPAVALTSWLTPDRAWMPISRLLAQISGYAGVRRRENTRHIGALLQRGNADASVIATALGAHHHHARLQLFRCYRSPEWRPPMRLVGREHLDAALASGNGAVLWTAPFVYRNLIAKMALYEAGVASAHLSGTQHGLSNSQFGQRFLNPIWMGIEDRFLAERVMMATAEAPAALRQLMRRVTQNHVISIAMGPHGSRQHRVPFLRGTFTVANGAASLARRCHSSLLPVFTVRDSDGTTVTTIEPPATVAADLPRDELERAIVIHSIRVLEPYVQRWPDQFDGWTMTDT